MWGSQVRSGLSRFLNCSFSLLVPKSCHSAFGPEPSFRFAPISANDDQWRAFAKRTQCRPGAFDGNRRKGYIQRCEIRVMRIDSLFSPDLASAPIANVCSRFLALFVQFARRVQRCAASRPNQPELTLDSFQIVSPFGLCPCS
jgi:hypothetical protein